MRHWIYNNKEINNIGDFPKGTYGFVYKITNLTRNKVYFGQKRLRTTRNTRIAKSTYDKIKDDKSIETHRRKDKKKSKKGKKVYFYTKKVIKESNWKTYVGSNKQLKKDYKNGDEVIREILTLCNNKTDLNYEETKAILCSGCFDMGEDCYNEWASVKIRKEFLSINKSSK